MPELQENRELVSLKGMRGSRRTLLSLMTVTLISLTLAATGLGDSLAPTGHWITIDDDGKTRKSVGLLELQGDTLKIAAARR